MIPSKHRRLVSKQQVTTQLLEVVAVLSYEEPMGVAKVFLMDSTLFNDQLALMGGAVAESKDQLERYDRLRRNGVRCRCNL